MRTIEQGHLALVIRFLTWHEEHMETSLVSRELVGHFLGSLNHPQMEGLSLNNEVVAVTNLLLDLSNLLAGETWNDTVNECSVNTATVLKPLFESCRQLPQFDILIDAIFQHMTIEEDEFAGEDD